MTTITPDFIDHVFGPGEGGFDLEQRARASTREYVRSLDQLAEASPEAKGRHLTAHEALQAYGVDVLREVADEGAALLAASPRAAGRMLRSRRKLLGLELRKVANAARVDRHVLESAEAGLRVPIREVEKAARVLGLDERLLSWRSDPPSVQQSVAVRLRTIGDDLPQMTPTAVVGIAEAAWVASTQLRLEALLGLAPRDVGLEKSPDFGGYGRPPYACGYDLAAQTRDRLQLGDDRLPLSLRELCEETLGIPVIQSELGPDIAGITVELGRQRAIVLNLDGQNRNVLVRRATIAHELCHLLYDPSPQLDALRVDSYQELDRHTHEIRDPVEQRANAFAIELIAPRPAVVQRYQATVDDPVWEVMDHFGISHTAARYQIWNGLRRTVPLDRIACTPGRRPDPHWEGSEAFTVDYHPVQGLKPSRAGRFSAVVLRAAEERLVSWDSAAAMLDVTTTEVRDAAPLLRGLFPAVWPGR